MEVTELGSFSLSSTPATSVLCQGPHHQFSKHVLYVNSLTQFQVQRIWNVCSLSSVQSFYPRAPISFWENAFSLNCVAWWEGNACLLLGKCRGQRLLSGSQGVSTCPHLTNQCSPLCLWGMSDTEEGWVAVGVPVEMLLGVWRPGAHSALHISSFQASSWFSELLGPYNKQASGFSRYTESLTTTPAR